ncbi:relaxase/mobilization nuclease domain-containing protein [Micrococcus luteus]|nr:relaxase/mobilization nuclease domain-containing protein [Micrococcus luteus]
MPSPIAAVVMASPTRNAARLLRYVSQPKKGQAKGDRFVAASGLHGAIPEVVHLQMRDVRRRFGKAGERRVEVPVKGGGTTTVTEGEYVQAYHVIQSFARKGEGALDPENHDDWERAHELGRALADRVAGPQRMATVWTQIDGSTGCIHNHLVIDSIDRESGRSFDSARVKHSVLATTHDEVLRESGYEQQNELQSTAAERKERSEDRAYLAHQQWVANGRQGREPFSVKVMKQRIEETLRQTNYVDFEAFGNELLANGVFVEQHGKQGEIGDESGRGLTYTMSLADPDGEDGWADFAPAHRRRASKLGRNYQIVAVEAAIARNKQAAAQHALADQRKHEIRAEQQPAHRFTLHHIIEEFELGEPFARTTRKAIADQHGAETRARQQPARRLTLQHIVEEFELGEPPVPAPRPTRVERAPESDPVETVQESVVPPVEAVPAPKRPEDTVAENDREEVPYRSPVRNLPLTRERDRAFRERMAGVDEHIVQQAQADEAVDDVLLKGLGPTQLRAYRGSLHADTIRLLELRIAMQRAATTAYEQGRPGRAQQIRAEIESGRYRRVTGGWYEPASQSETEREAERDREHGD